MEKKYEIESKPIEKREDGILIQPLDSGAPEDGGDRMTLTIVISICA